MLRVHEAVVHAMAAAPLDQLSWACSVGFERGLSVVVIFGANGFEKTGEDRLQNREQVLNERHVSCDGQIFRFVDDESLEKAEHRAHSKGEGSHIERRSVADFLSTNMALSPKESRIGLRRLKNCS